jgi:V/A-type H+-transporting ATPase subunit A
LQEEEKLLEIVQLVGSDALPEKQQTTILVARLIREGFLQQNAFHDVDTTCSLAKSYRLMKALLYFNRLCMRAVESGARTTAIAQLKCREELLLAKYEPDDEKYLAALMRRMDDEFMKLTSAATNASGTNNASMVSGANSAPEATPKRTEVRK